MISLSDFLQRELNRASESQIIEALKKLMSTSQKETCEEEPDYKLSGRPYPFRGDLYAPAGIEGLEIDKPTMVEVKSALLIPTFQRELKKGEEYVKEHENEIYLVVYANSSLNQVPSRPSENVWFMHFDEVRERLEKNDTENPQEIEKTEPFTPIPQETLIRAAAERLKFGHATFVLGSGVSVDAGSPIWDVLLKGLLKKNQSLLPLGSRVNDYNSIKDYCGWSSIVTARYIVGDLASKACLEENMRELIYGNSKKWKYKTDETALPVIAQIIKKCKVDGAITFNYDEFLEEALEKEKCNYISFCAKGALGEEFPVFHVHGLISRNGEGGTMQPVLSEEEYHALYSNDFHWSNVEILRALMRTSCFFVGLSMTDPNLRRLLDIARRGDDRECPHYLFLQRTPLDKENPDEECDKKHWEQVECQYAQMGVNVIWFDYNPENDKDFTDLARKLKKIKNKIDNAGNPQDGG